MDNQTRQALVDAMKQLSDLNSSTRLEAVRRFGEIGISHPQIIERLQAMAQNDATMEVRVAARQTLDILQSGAPRSTPQGMPQPTQSAAPHSTPQSVPQATQFAAEAYPQGDVSVLDLLQKQNEILENLRVLIQRSTEAQSEKGYSLRTSIADMDMPILSMIKFIFKWFVASIPVMIVSTLFFFLLSGCFAAVLRTR